MERNEILQLLEQHHALITPTHVVYTSGRHGDTYVNKDAIYPDVRAISTLCQALAQPFLSSQIEVVAAPAIGGVILSQWTAHHLSAGGSQPLAVYAEKSESGGFLFRRGYDRLISGRRVLVVEDILTTGGSVREVVRSVAAAGGNVVGVAALCNRGAITAEQIGSPMLHSLVDIELRSWPEESCALCASGVPINVDVGKGRDFLARKGHTTQE